MSGFTIRREFDGRTMRHFYAVRRHGWHYGSCDSKAEARMAIRAEARGLAALLTTATV